MSEAKHGPGYIMGFAVAVCLVCSLGVSGAAISLKDKQTENAIGFTSPATYAAMTDTIFASASSSGDKKPDSSTLFMNDFIGDVTLSESEWAQVKETFGTYSALVS